MRKTAYEVKDDGYKARHICETCALSGRYDNRQLGRKPHRIPWRFDIPCSDCGKPILRRQPRS